MYDKYHKYTFDCKIIWMSIYFLPGKVKNGELSTRVAKFKIFKIIECTFMDLLR